MVLEPFVAKTAQLVRPVEPRLIAVPVPPRLRVVAFAVPMPRVPEPAKVSIVAPVASLIFPLLSTVNLVVPEAEAAIRFPLLVLFTINEALLPIPPETDSTAWVFAEDPTFTPESKSDNKVKLPLPAAALRVNPALPDVWIVAAEPLPKVAVVPLTVKLLARVKAPALVMTFVPLKKLIFPVLPSPKVSDCLAVVAKTPLALK